MLKKNIDQFDTFFKQWDYTATEEIRNKGLNSKYIADGLGWGTEEVNTFMLLQRGWRRLTLAENTYWFDANAFKVVSQTIEEYLKRTD